MTVPQNIQTFAALLSILDDVSEDKRVDFLMQLRIDNIADALVEDNPVHFTLLKRIMELLTLVPIEERYIVEEIAALANEKHTQLNYNQFRLFSGLGADDPGQNRLEDESDFPSLA